MIRSALFAAAACGAFVLGMMIASFFLPAQAVEPCAANTVPPANVSRAADPMPEILYETADVLFDICMAGEHVYGCADTVHNKLYLWIGLTPGQSACVLEHELAHFPPGNWVH